MDEQAAREYYVRLQVLQRHLQQLNEHLEEIDGKTVELRRMIDAVEEARTIEDGADILVPVTSGIFIPATAQKPTQLYLNVGAQTVIAKSPQEAIAILQKQQEELASYREQVREQQRSIAHEAERLEQEVERKIRDNV